jgi:uncharacterized protein with HEPN domain
MLSDIERDALEDIRDNIARAMRFVDGCDLDAFLADDKTFYVATRCLEIISEASRRLPSVFKERFPESPWKQVAGSGSIYRHNYENVQACESGRRFTKPFPRFAPLWMPSCTSDLRLRPRFDRRPRPQQPARPVETAQILLLDQTCTCRSGWVKIRTPIHT